MGVRQGMFGRVRVCVHVCVCVCVSRVVSRRQAGSMDRQTNHTRKRTTHERTHLEMQYDGCHARLHEAPEHRVDDKKRAAQSPAIAEAPAPIGGVAPKVDTLLVEHARVQLSLIHI